MSKQKTFFKGAYDLGEQRVPAGYGWPMTVDLQQLEFLDTIKQSTSNGKTLDIGCGQGRHTFMFAQNGFDAYGIDFVERPIQEARKLAETNGNKNVHFEVMDVLDLDFADNFFDIVLGWSVLDHIYPKNWQTYVKNVSRVLKPGGFLILTEFSAKDVRIKSPTDNARDEDNYDHFFREDEIAELFDDKFEVIEIVHNELRTTSHFAMINVLLCKRS
jgi:ubiquinone/menaquinone biosynthesis C-methylase UbiE